MESLTLSVTVAVVAFSILLFLLLLTRRHAGVGAGAGAGSLPPVPGMSHVCMHVNFTYEQNHKVGLFGVACACSGSRITSDRESSAIEGEETLQDLHPDGSQTWAHLFHPNRCFHSHCSQLSPPC